MSDNFIDKYDVSKLIKIYKKYTIEQLSDYFNGNNTFSLSKDEINALNKITNISSDPIDIIEKISIRYNELQEGGAKKRRRSRANRRNRGNSQSTSSSRSSSNRSSESSRNRNRNKNKKKSSRRASEAYRNPNNRNNPINNDRNQRGRDNTKRKDRNDKRRDRINKKRDRIDKKRRDSDRDNKKIELSGELSANFESGSISDSYDRSEREEIEEKPRFLPSFFGSRRKKSGVKTSRMGSGSDVEQDIRRINRDIQSLNDRLYNTNQDITNIYDEIDAIKNNDSSSPMSNRSSNSQMESERSKKERQQTEEINLGDSMDIFNQRQGAEGGYSDSDSDFENINSLSVISNNKEKKYKIIKNGSNFFFQKISN